MPPLAVMLCRYWDVNERLARRWWRAVATARWSVVQEWRRKVLLFDQQLAPALSAQQAVSAVERFLGTSATPGAVLAVLENLVRERALSRADARQMERNVLEQVDHEGRWK